MADESSFIVEILLRARDEASANIAALRAEIAALKREAEGGGGSGGATGRASKDIDETGRAARDSERDIRGARQEHERLRQSSRGTEVREGGRELDALGQSARKTEGELQRSRVAVDDHRSASSRLASTQKEATKATDEHSDSVKRSAERAEEAARSFELFDAAVKKGSIGNDDARRGYNQFAQELGGVARAFKAGSDEALRYSRIASEAKSRSGDFGASEAEIRRVTGAYKDFNEEVSRGSLKTSEVKRGYQDFASELGSIGRAFRAGSQEAEKFLGMADQAASKAKKAGTLSPGDWNIDNFIEKTAAHFDQWGVKIVSLSAQLRGLMLAGAIGFAQQLDTAVVGLAGGLFSVAAAAAQAGAAIGGALVAGISQAVPVLGIIGAAVDRLKTVFQAVNLSNQIEATEYAQPHRVEAAQLQATNSVASAQNSLAQAYEGVTTAQEHVRSSQEALTLSRITAIRNIIDLTLAEKNAKLQAEGASLSLVDAQRQLQVAVQQGNTAGIQSAQLAVKQAELGVEKARNEVPRAEEDAARARRQGVEGAPGVMSAREAEKAAQQTLNRQGFQIQQSRNQLRLAEIQASETQRGSTPQQAQLAVLEKQMSGPEKVLFSTLQKLDQMMQSPNSPLRKLSDAIVSPVADGVKRISQLIESPAAMKPLETLAKAIGGGVSEIIHTLTGSKAVKFFGEMAADASKNVPIVADSFSKLLEIFQAIAKASSPFLHEIIKGFNEFVTKRASPEGLEKLETFFVKAAHYARDIADLAGAFVRLVLALGRDAAPAGGNLIEDLTKSMNEATSWVNTHGPQVTKFFHETAEVVKQIGTLLFGLGGAMIKVFNPSSTAALQGVLTQILIPALTKVLDVLGWITTAFLNLAKAIPGGTVTLQILAGLALTLFGLGKLYEPIAKIVGVMKGLVLATEAFAAASDVGIIGRMAAAWTAFGTAMKGVATSTSEAAAAQTALDDAQAAGGATGAAAGAGGAAAGAGLLGGAARFGLTRVLPAAAVLFGLHEALPSGEGPRGPQGIPTTGSNFQRDIRQFQNEYADIKHVDPVGFVKDLFGGSETSKSEEQLRKFGTQLSKIKGNLSDLPKDQMKKINAEAIKLGEDPSLSKFRKQLEAVANATDPSLAATKKWSEKMREYFKSLGPAAADVAKSFESINASAGSILRQVSEIVSSNTKKIAEDLGTNTKQGKDALVANFGQAVVAIQKAMEEGTVSTGKGMQDIGKLVAAALKEYGINPSQINKYVASTGQLLSTNKAGGLIELPFPKAAGGWVSPQPGGSLHQLGEAGHRELVISTDPKYAPRTRQLLGEYAGGGFIPEGQPVKIERVDEGQDLLTTPGGPLIAPGKGYVASVKSDEKGFGPDYPLDYFETGPYARKTMYLGHTDTALPAGAHFKLDQIIAHTSRTGHNAPPGWAEIGDASTLGQGNTGQGRAIAAMFSGSLGKGAQALLGSASSAYEIAAPQVKGLSGGLQKIAQGALNKVAKAASDYVQGVIGTLPAASELGAPSSPGSTPKGTVSQWLTEALRITHHFSSGNLRALYGRTMQESGGNPHSTNLTDSNAQAGHPSKGLLETIPETFNAYKLPGHGNVWNPVDNAIAAIRYMYARYGHIVGPGAGGYASGGKIAPWGGRPVVIEAHEGERVMNPSQYGEAARLAGTTPSGLDRHMGYDGIPKQRFQDGGIPRIIGVHNQPITGSPMPAAAPAGFQLGDLGRLSDTALASNSKLVQVFKAVHDGFSALAKIEGKAGAFVGAVMPFINSLTDEQTGLFARLATAFTTLTSRLNSAAAKASFKVVGGSGGREVSSAPPLEQVDRTLKNLQTERKNLQEQERIVGEAEKQIAKRIQALSKKKQTSAVKKELQQLIGAYNKVIEIQNTLEEQMAQNLEAAAQASQQRVQDVITQINNTIGLQATELQSRQGQAQSLGNFGELSGIDKQIEQNAREHIVALEGALQQASAIGDSEMVATIRSEIAGLRATVTQAASQAITDAEAAIQQEAGITTANASVYAARAQFFEGQGSFNAAAGNAQAGYETERTGKLKQFKELQGLRQIAEAEGNTGQVATLTQAIKALEVSMMSNEQALRDNTASVDSLYQSNVQRQGQFATGVATGLGGILRTLGEITGKLNVPALKKLYEGSNESLKRNNEQIVGGPQGLEAFAKEMGINLPSLKGLSGEALVETLSKLNFSEIESKLDPAQQAIFDQMIQALIGNTAQIEANNKELAILNGALMQPQTFSTSAFQKFRSAFFTGMGGLLPAYAQSLGIPIAPNPGLTGSGSGEQTISTKASQASGASVSGDQNVHVNVTTPMPVLDPNHVGAVIAFHMKTPGQ